MKEQIIWAMDSDCCEMCNRFLDYFGQCPHCGWDSIYGYACDATDDFYADWYEDAPDGTPENVAGGE